MTTAQYNINEQEAAELEQMLQTAQALEKAADIIGDFDAESVQQDKEKSAISNIKNMLQS